MCLFLQSKKRCPYFFCSDIPSFCITSVFSEGQLNLFDRGTAEHLWKHTSLCFFLPFKPQLLLPAEPSLNRIGFVLAEWGFPCGSAGKESACNAESLGSVPGLGRSLEKVRYSGLENSMDSIVHGVLESWTRLGDFHFHHQFSTVTQSCPTLCDARPPC